MKLKLKDAIPIGISVIALAFSIYSWKSAKNEVQRAQDRAYLVNFLHPLKSYLNMNRDRQIELNTALSVPNLENAPDYVQQALHKGLSLGDPLWVKRYNDIEVLLNENEKAIKLVEEYIGWVERRELQTRLEDFKRHALDLKSMWGAIMNPYPALASNYKGAGRLESEPFPAGLDKLLDDEISRVEALLGLRAK
jgi:hypothetical protein